MNTETIIEVVREFGSFGFILLMLGYMFYMTIKRIAPAFDRLTVAIQENTKQSSETHEFMKNLNGKLVQAAKDKLK